MGLEFQSRAFVHVRGPDRLVPPPETRWVVTGRRRNFFHNCQEGKSAAFHAAIDIHTQSDQLENSFGLVSIQQDWLDHGDRSRAYVLNAGALREIDTRDVGPSDERSSKQPAGLLDHFAWTQHCYWGFSEEFLPGQLQNVATLTACPDLVNAAGWFFIDRENESFPLLLSLFGRNEIATVTQSSCWIDHYLFVGEESIPIREALLPIVEASIRFPEGAGMLFSFSDTSINQIAIQKGQCRVLAPLVFDQLTYHKSVRFRNARFGYDPRPED